MSKDNTINKGIDYIEYIIGALHMFPWVATACEIVRQRSRKELDIPILTFVFLLDIIIRREVVTFLIQSDTINAQEADFIIVIYGLVLGFWFLHRNGNFSDKINP